MYLRDSNQPFANPVTGETVTERQFLSDWRNAKGIPADKEMFISSLPSADSLYGIAGDFSSNLAQDEFLGIRAQFKNFDKALGQAFFNKINIPEMVAKVGGGSLSEYIPAIAEVAMGVVEAIMSGNATGQRSAKAV